MADHVSGPRALTDPPSDTTNVNHLSSPERCSPDPEPPDPASLLADAAAPPEGARS